MESVDNAGQQGQAVNFLIYSRSSWQREEEDEAKTVCGYRDAELAIIADGMNYDCVDASDVQSSANVQPRYPLVFDPILTG